VQKLGPANCQHRESAADEPLVRVEGSETILVLMTEALAWQHRVDFVSR
jgi:hypothetical protein